jgi:hypothetical protein
VRRLAAAGTALGIAALVGACGDSPALRIEGTASDRGAVRIPSATPTGTAETRLLAGPGTRLIVHNGTVGVAVGDVNGDGLTDVALGSNAGGPARILFGDGQTARIRPTEIEAIRAIRVNPGRATDRALVPSAAGDVNGDGLADVLLVAASPRAAAAGLAWIVLGRRAPGTISLTYPGRSALRIRADGRLGPAAAAGDVDGDGFGDVVIGTADGAIIVHGSRAPADIELPGGAGSVTMIHGPPGTGATVAGVGDVNGDGLADVAIGAAAIGTPIAVVTGRSDRRPLDLTTAAGVTTMTGVGTAAESAVAVAAGDVNGDGYPDIVATGCPGACVVFGRRHLPARIDRTALGRSGFAIAGAAAASATAIGDANGDGLADVAVDTSRATGAVAVIFGAADAEPVDVRAPGRRGFLLAARATALPYPFVLSFLAAWRPGVAGLVVAALPADGPAGAVRYRGAVFVVPLDAPTTPVPAVTRSASTLPGVPVAIAATTDGHGVALLRTPGGRLLLRLGAPAAPFPVADDTLAVAAITDRDVWITGGSGQEGWALHLVDGHRTRRVLLRGPGITVATRGHAVWIGTARTPSAAPTLTVIPRFGAPVVSDLLLTAVSIAPPTVALRDGSLLNVDEHTGFVYQQRGRHVRRSDFLVPVTLANRELASLPTGQVVVRSRLVAAVGAGSGADQIEFLNARLQQIGERLLIDGGPGLATTADGTTWFLDGRRPSLLYRIVPGIDGAIRVPITLAGMGTTALAAAGRTVWIGGRDGHGGGRLVRLSIGGQR